MDERVPLVTGGVWHRWEPLRHVRLSDEEYGYHQCVWLINPGKAPGGLRRSPWSSSLSCRNGHQRTPTGMGRVLAAAVETEIDRLKQQAATLRRLRAGLLGVACTVDRQVDREPQTIEEADRRRAGRPDGGGHLELNLRSNEEFAESNGSTQ
jgi:hypothetical protein